jgi:hypothetical protein
MLKLLMGLFGKSIYPYLCGMKGSTQYSKKFPFVAKVVSGNGAVCVIDTDGVSLTKMNWDMFDRMFPDGSDADFDAFQVLRNDAVGDPFIQKLEEMALDGNPVCLDF